MIKDCIQKNSPRYISDVRAKEKETTFAAFFTMLYLSYFMLKVFQTKPLVLKYLFSLHGTPVKSVLGRCI